MFRSIRWRIAIPYTLLIIATMVAITYYFSNNLQHLFYDNLKARLITNARLIEDELASNASIENASPITFHELATRWSGLVDARVTLIAPDGTVLGDSQEDERTMENHINRVEIRSAQETGFGSSSRYSSTLGYEMYYVAIAANDPVSVGFVRLAVPISTIQAILRNLFSTLGFITVIASLMAIALAFWIAGRTTRPLRYLTQAASRISSGDLRSRIIPTTSDEVATLTQAFNLMAFQLETQINALESERSKSLAVLGNMTDGVIIADSNSLIQLINPAAMSMFEVSEQAALGRTLIEVFRLHQLVELWEKCMASGETQITNLEIPSRQLSLQSIATPLGNYLPGNILLLFQNMTRLRHLETVRQDFISNISHELRTPIASLKALTETLQEGALEDPPAARRFLDQMVTEVDAVNMMVSELLELSKIESGKVPFHFSPTPPAEIVYQATDRLKLQAERAGLHLEIEVPEDLPDVNADQSRLEQVLVNLLHNAIKFTPEGGQILVKAERSTNIPGDYVLFIVNDTGIGIPPVDLPRIFERFYKTDRARSGGGTGLGLAIARHTVEAHGGVIWAESVEGHGSSFFFTIPIAT